MTKDINDKQDNEQETPDLNAGTPDDASKEATGESDDSEKEGGNKRQSTIADFLSNLRDMINSGNVHVETFMAGPPPPPPQRERRRSSSAASKREENNALKRIRTTLESSPVTERK